MVSEQCHILVVEDEEDILALLHFNLLKEGFRGTCVSSGEEALQTIENEPLDLMVLDPSAEGLNV